MIRQADKQDSGQSTGCRLCRILVGVGVFAVLIGLLYAAWRFGADRPVDYAAIEDHFKYGSTGGEREAGFPYWLWRALPHVCHDKLPARTRTQDKEYQVFGFIYEGDKDLPIGVSKRRHFGLDRVFLNCAVCHTSTVREKPESTPMVVTGMPANTVRLMEFEKFMFDCAKDGKFSRDYIIPEVRRLGGKLDLIDRYLVYPFAIHLMRERLLMLESRFVFMLKAPDWGPGRVDTFGSAKALFNFPMEKAPARELIGVTDFPSIWLQAPRQIEHNTQVKKNDEAPCKADNKNKKKMQLHWDGNNTKVEERNRSAAFGTGATPPTLDRERIKRVEDWLLTKAPPNYPYSIDQTLAAKGAGIYKQYCAGCHGISGRDFTGELVGEVTPIEDVRTDPHRLDSYTYELAVNQNLLYAGTQDPKERFSHFCKTFGYANMPLDGLWLRAPYLHNGSVPTLRDLLEPAARRPKTFYRGYDVYDQEKVGFVSLPPKDNGRYFLFNTAVEGNSNKGHEGVRYGTELAAGEKVALVEHLKTF